MRFIRKPWRYIPREFIGKSAVAYIKVDDLAKLTEVGFSSPLVPNEAIVPAANMNRATKENANGKETIRKDLPKEDYIIDFSAEVPNFGDPLKGYHTISGSFTRKKYHRDHSIPLLLKFVLVVRGPEMFVYSEPIECSETNEDILCGVLNLFRFCFGSIPLFASDYEEPIYSVVKKEWTLLPAGENVDRVDLLMKRLHPSGQTSPRLAERKRFDLLIKHSSDNVVNVGTNEFEGYFCIKTIKAYILECIYTNNATYVLKLDDDWESISKMTKTEIISSNAAVRVFHTVEWEKNISLYF